MLERTKYCLREGTETNLHLNICALPEGTLKQLPPMLLGVREMKKDQLVRSCNGDGLVLTLACDEDTDPPKHTLS